MMWAPVVAVFRPQRCLWSGPGLHDKAPAEGCAPDGRGNRSDGCGQSPWVERVRRSGEGTRWQSGSSRAVCRRDVVLVAKCDVLSIEGHDPMIGNRDPMSVAAKISHHLRGTAEGGLGIDNPILPVGLLQELSELLRRRQRSGGAGTVQFSAPVQALEAGDRLAAENTAQRLH